VQEEDSPAPKIVVGPPRELARYRVFFAPEDAPESDAALEAAGFVPLAAPGHHVGPDGLGQVEMGGGPPYRIQGETESDVRSRLLQALGREPTGLKIVRQPAS